MAGVRGTRRAAAAVRCPQAALVRSARLPDDEETRRKIAGRDGKLARYRAALDAGASPATAVAGIAKTEAEKPTHQLAARPAHAHTRMSQTEIHIPSVQVTTP